MPSMKVWSRLALAASAGIALGLPAHGQGPSAVFTGEQDVKVSVTAAYGSVYSARTVTPTLQVIMTDAGSGHRTVLIKNKQYAEKYECALKAKIEGGNLVFAPAQTCTLSIATPDFCVLERARCDARARNLRCAQEKSANHLGKLMANLISGKVESPTGKWILAAELRADGCVLAEGYNKNAPILVRGGAVTVGRP